VPLQDVAQGSEVARHPRAHGLGVVAVSDVDPVRSQKTMVTVLRTSTGADAGLSRTPHSEQNFGSSMTPRRRLGTASPHRTSDRHRDSSAM